VKKERILSLEDVYRVDKKGANLFEALAEQAMSTEVKPLFLQLAEEELKHIRLVSKLLYYVGNKVDWKNEQVDGKDLHGVTMVQNLPVVDPSETPHHSPVIKRKPSERKME
jgi:rubrerythrin